MSQKCTKCGKQDSDPEYTINKHNGYCLDCVELLKLGTHGQKIIPKDFFKKQDNTTDSSQ